MQKYRTPYRRGVVASAQASDSSSEGHRGSARRHRNDRERRRPRHDGYDAPVDATARVDRRVLAAHGATPTAPLGAARVARPYYLAETTLQVDPRRSGVDINLDHGVDNMAMAMSLVASTRGVALVPAYAKNLLPSSVVSRSLQGEAPTIEVAVGYSATRITGYACSGSRWITGFLVRRGRNRREQGVEPLGHRRVRQNRIAQRRVG